MYVSAFSRFAIVFKAYARLFFPSPQNYIPCILRVSVPYYRSCHYVILFELSYSVSLLRRWWQLTYCGPLIISRVAVWTHGNLCGTGTTSPFNRDIVFADPSGIISTTRRLASDTDIADPLCGHPSIVY